MNFALADNSEFIRKLTEIVHQNLGNENFGVDELVKETGLSPSIVRRRLKAVKGKNINQFIHEVRLQRALEMLQQGALTASEVSWQVGFNSPAYFTKSFHEYFGYPPGEIRKKEHHSSGSNGITSLPDQRDIPALREKQIGMFHSQKRTIQERILIPVVIILFLMLMGLFFSDKLSNSLTGFSSLKKNDPDKSIVVLPFKNLSNEPENQYFADGVMEDILNNLFIISELRVISRTTSEHYRDSKLTSPEVAGNLGVRYVLEGSVRRDQNKARIMVQLIDAWQDQHTWSEKFDTELTDIFAMQSDIAKQVAEKTQTVISPKEILRIEKIPTRNPEAYDLYLMGRFFINKRTRAGFEKSADYFEKAIVADTLFALAYAGLAEAYGLFAWYRWYPLEEGFIKAKDNALKALAIDKNLGEAHAVLGTLLQWKDWKWEEARKELLLATQLSPNYAIAHSSYSELLDVLGEKEEARRQVIRAIELDPYFPLLHVLSAVYFKNNGLYRESQEEYFKAMELDPEYLAAYWGIFNNYLMLGKNEKAVAALETALSKDTLTQKFAPEVQIVYARSGFNGLLKWLIGIKSSEKNPRFLDIAQWHNHLGERTEALYTLEKALSQRFPALPRINVITSFDNLRSEPGFQKIIGEMGMTPYHRKIVRERKL